MHLHFFLRFHTEPGQTLWMNTKSMAGIGEPDVKELPLKYLNSEAWELELDITQGQKNFQYSYFLKTAEGIIVNEGETARQVYLQNSNVAAIDIIDTWNHTGEYENIFFTRPFSEYYFINFIKRRKQKKDLNPVSCFV